jgi:GTP-binding protein
MAAPKRIDYLGSADKSKEYPRTDLPEIAFSGRSNVGKSSLINTLVGRKGLARISRTPGKTQRIHFYQVDSRFILVDLPGYGYAKVPEQIKRRWGPMIETYLSGRKTLKLLAVLLDLRRIDAGAP